MPTLSPTVQEFAREHYEQPEPRAAIMLAAWVTTVLYQELVTSADTTWPAVRGYNGYMILAMCREMSRE